MQNNLTKPCDYLVVCKEVPSAQPLYKALQPSNMARLKDKRKPTLFFFLFSFFASL